MADTNTPETVDAFLARQAFEYQDDDQDGQDYAAFVADVVPQMRFTADGVRLEGTMRQRREGRKALLAEQRRYRPDEQQRYYEQHIAPYDTATEEQFVGPQRAALERFVNET